MDIDLLTSKNERINKESCRSINWYKKKNWYRLTITIKLSFTTAQI